MNQEQHMKIAQWVILGLGCGMVFLAMMLLG